MPCQFFSTSVDREGTPEFDDMIANAKRISYKSFVRYVPLEELAEVFPQYDWQGTGGPTMEQDPEVTFFKSKYSGNFAVYVEAGPVEYVWICGMQHPRTLEQQEVDDIRRRSGIKEERPVPDAYVVHYKHPRKGKLFNVKVTIADDPDEAKVKAERIMANKYADVLAKGYRLYGVSNVEAQYHEFPYGDAEERMVQDEANEVRRLSGLPPLTEAGFGPERGPLEFEKITDYNLDDNELQERLLFWILAGGMSSTMAAKGLHGLMQASGGYDPGVGPFEAIRRMESPEHVAKALQQAGYSFFNQRAKYIWAAAHEQIDLRHGTMGDILCFKGVGLKSASCFLLHSRENIEMAGLDTHILKWLKAKGVEGVPKATPSSKKVYDRLEQEFLKMAKERGMSPTDLDLAIWNAQRQGEVYP